MGRATLWEKSCEVESSCPDGLNQVEYTLRKGKGQNRCMNTVFTIATLITCPSSL
jgi:hypothetical protein